MINETLKALRKRKGVTAKAVAETLNILPDTYRSYESGRREPNLETLKAISEYFEVSADYLLSGENPLPEQLTESEKDLEACILEKYKQLPESYRKKFLQGVMEAVEIQKRERVTQETVDEEQAAQKTAGNTEQPTNKAQQAETATQGESTQQTMQDQDSPEEEQPQKSMPTIQQEESEVRIRHNAIMRKDIKKRASRNGEKPFVRVLTEEQKDEIRSRPRADEDM